MKKNWIKRKGRIGRLWDKTKAEWFLKHPADFYYCHYCLSPLQPKYTTLDHLEGRGRHPELRFDMNNLVPCCWPDNDKKGSTSHDEYVKKYYPDHECAQA